MYFITVCKIVAFVVSHAEELQMILKNLFWSCLLLRMKEKFFGKI